MSDSKRFIVTVIYTAIVLLLIEVVLVNGSVWWWNLVKSHGNWNVVNRFFITTVVWCICYSCTNPGKYEE